MSSVSQDIALLFDAVRNTWWVTCIDLFVARDIVKRVLFTIFFLASFLHLH